MSTSNREIFEAHAAEILQSAGEKKIVVKNTPYDRYKHDRLVGLYDALPIRGRSILEVGCGPGSWLVRAHKLGARRVAGCDLASGMIELATENTAAAGMSDVTLRKTDGVSVPYDDREFEVVYTITVLQHNSDEEKLNQLMADICRVSSEEVWLAEDTSDRVKGWPSYLRRPVAYYEEVMQRHGFSLESTASMNTYYSEVVCAKWLVRLLRDPTRWGAYTPRASTNICMKAILPFTALLDRWVPCVNVLSIMRFRRQQG